MEEETTTTAEGGTDNTENPVMDENYHLEAPEMLAKLAIARKAVQQVGQASLNSENPVSAGVLYAALLLIDRQMDAIETVTRPAPSEDEIGAFLTQLGITPLNMAGLDLRDPLTPGD